MAVDGDNDRFVAVQDTAGRISDAGLDHHAVL